METPIMAYIGLKFGQSLTLKSGPKPNLLVIEDLLHGGALTLFSEKSAGHLWQRSLWMMSSRDAFAQS